MRHTLPTIPLVKPVEPSTKDEFCGFRLSGDDLAMLKEITAHLDINKSEFVRHAIRSAHAQLTQVKAA